MTEFSLLSGITNLLTICATRMNQSRKRKRSFIVCHMLIYQFFYYIALSFFSFPLTLCFFSFFFSRNDRGNVMETVIGGISPCMLQVSCSWQTPVLLVVEAICLFLYGQCNLSCQAAGGDEGTKSGVKSNNRESTTARTYFIDCDLNGV